MAEDPDHAEKPYFISRDRIDQAKRMLQEGRAKGIEFVLPIDFVLADGSVAEKIGPGDQQFDVGPKTSKLFAEKVGKFMRAIERARRPSPSTTACSACSKIRGSKTAPSSSSRELKRMTDAGVEVYIGGGEGGTSLERYGQPDWVTHCFTAGGTVLNALGSAPVPYLVALYMAGKK